MPQRILVTGATGFVGRHICRVLAEGGHNVLALTRATDLPLAMRGGPGSVMAVQGDCLARDGLQDILTVHRPDVIIHGAWTTEHGAFWHDPQNLDWVRASLLLLQQAQAAGVSRFLGVGTCVEYGETVTGLCHETSTPMQPHTLYGISKHAAHQVMGSYAKAHGLSFAWGRLFHVTGAGEPMNKLLSYMTRTFAAGEVPVLNKPDAQLDLIDVQDCGHALAALALSNCGGPVNIASGQAMTIGALAGQVARHFGSPYDPPEPDRERERGLVADVGRMQSCMGRHAGKTLPTIIEEIARTQSASTG